MKHTRYYEEIFFQHFHFIVSKDGEIEEDVKDGLNAGWLKGDLLLKFYVMSDTNKIEWKTLRNNY